MTEAEWLGNGDRAGPFPSVHAALQSLRLLGKADQTKAGRRKLRLFSCACCRRHWSSLNECSRDALALAERFADGFATRAERWACWKATPRSYGTQKRTPDDIAGHVVEKDELTAAALAAGVSYSVFCSMPRLPQELGEEEFALFAVLRDIFGNPFRPVAFNPAWRTATVTSLAQAIYVDRRFADLPILADALEDAGCASADVLDHCRTPGEHVRGCWVVDLALAKE